MKKMYFTLILTCLSLLLMAQEYPISTRISFQKDNLKIQAYIQPFDKKEIRTNADTRYFFYYHNRIQNLQGDYMGDLLNGNYRELDEQHRLRKAGKFHQGVKCGSWKDWDEKGELRSITNFKKGKLHGEVTTFSQHGRIARTEIFKNGKSTTKGYVIENGKKVRSEAGKKLRAEKRKKSKVNPNQNPKNKKDKKSNSAKQKKSQKQKGNLR